MFVPSDILCGLLIFVAVCAFALGYAGGTAVKLKEEILEDIMEELK